MSRLVVAAPMNATGCSAVAHAGCPPSRKNVTTTRDVTVAGPLGARARSGRVLLAASEEPAELVAETTWDLVEQLGRVDPEARQQVGVLGVVHRVRQLLVCFRGVVVAALALEEVDDGVLVELHDSALRRAGVVAVGELVLD